MKKTWLLFYLMQIANPFVFAADNIKKEVSSKTSSQQEFKSEFGFSLKYEKCYDIVVGPEEDETDLTSARHLTFLPTDKCVKLDQGHWAMGFDLLRDNKSSNEYYIEDRSRPYPSIFKKNVKIGKYDAILFSGMKSEAHKLIDEKDQNNYLSVLKVICKKANIAIFYLDHLDKPQRDKQRITPEIPKVFTNLIDSFSCE